MKPDIISVTKVFSLHVPFLLSAELRDEEPDRRHPRPLIPITREQRPCPNGSAGSRAGSKQRGTKQSMVYLWTERGNSAGKGSRRADGGPRQPDPTRSKGIQIPNPHPPPSRSRTAGGLSDPPPQPLVPRDSWKGKKGATSRQRVSGGGSREGRRRMMDGGEEGVEGREKKGAGCGHHPGPGVEY